MSHGKETGGLRVLLRKACRERSGYERERERERERARERERERERESDTRGCACWRYNCAQ
jgi:hypothetical protein